MVIVDNMPEYTPYSFQTQMNCTFDNKEVKQFIFFEFGLKSLSPFLFFILGTMRYI